MLRTGSEEILDNLILNNIRQRPGRSLTTIAGVSLGVVLILLIVGLANGMLREKAERESNVGAEIMFRPSGSLIESLTASEMQMPVDMVAKVSQIPGVRMVTPVAQYIARSNSGIGFRAIDGVYFDEYARISEIKIIEGRPPQSDDEVLAAFSATSRDQYHPGRKITLLDREVTVSGVYWPESGGRIKVRLDSLQKMLGAAGRASFLLVKCESAGDKEQVQARLQAAFPGYYPFLTRDLPHYYAQGFPALNTFLRVVIGVAMVVSGLVILLAMYTTVTERTREIGILKSLGASKMMIVRLIEIEALSLGALGIAAGYFLALAGRYGITNYTSLHALDIEPYWMMIAGLISLVAAFGGALYPALRAANQDPVEALSYE